MGKLRGSRFPAPVVCVLAALALTALGFTPLLAGIARADMKALEEAARKEGPMTWYISFYGQEPADKVAAAFAQNPAPTMRAYSRDGPRAWPFRPGAASSAPRLAQAGRP
jgi:hypothetical protein